jgi:hypothetical protein
MQDSHITLIDYESWEPLESTIYSTNHLKGALFKLEIEIWRKWLQCNSHFIADWLPKNFAHNCHRMWAMPDLHTAEVSYDTEVLWPIQHEYEYLMGRQGSQGHPTLLNTLKLWLKEGKRLQVEVAKVNLGSIIPHNYILSQINGTFEQLSEPIDKHMAFTVPELDVYEVDLKASTTSTDASASASADTVSMLVIPMRVRALNSSECGDCMQPDKVTNILDTFEQDQTRPAVILILLVEVPGVVVYEHPQHRDRPQAPELQGRYSEGIKAIRKYQEMKGWDVSILQYWVRPNVTEEFERVEAGDIVRQYLGKAVLPPAAPATG